MEFQKAKILLEKMTALLRSMSADEQNVSAIEQDLMRSYIQQFYELFLEQGGLGTSAPQRNSPAVAEKIELIKPERKEPAPPPVQEPAPQIIVKKSKPANPPAPEKTVSFETEYKPPRIIDLPDSLKDLTEEQTPPPRTAPPEATKFNSTKVRVSEEVRELFETPQARELSEKLGELPIPDLTKAMGLNEKIFTINELFDGDQGAFKSVLQVLNNLKSFEQAQEYLITDVVNEFNWTDPGKQKKAKNFIKLIRRRYN